MRGFVLAGTGSGVGKTSVATGLMSRLSKTMDVQAFKAGPDFIDPMYHTAATGRPSRNLDSFLMGDDVIRNVAGYASRDADVCVVEGVRGLFEGYSGDGDLGSTAYIAKLLGLPVILIVDARSLTRSAAAIVNGFRAFDPDVRIAGVILNNVSGGQHAGKLRTAFETYCPDVRVVGMIPKSPGKALEQRYLGLKTLKTFAEREITPLQELTEPIDLDAVMDIVESTDADLPTSSPYTERDCGMTAAVPMDDAFCFYYRENIECLEASGFSVRTFRPTDGEALPDADLYYLGGGYPELYASAISGNRDFLEGIRTASSDGKVVIGECGGLMSMCRSIRDKDGNVHEMAGVFDAEASMTGVRHGPTYVIADATADNPAFSGTVRGHEYHYSDVFPASDAVFGFDVRRGLGISERRDGLVSGNSIGSYMHQHALSERDWIGPAVERISRRA
ncbi:MAG: cobyrinate a,c-diamide synthase [Thermoplasmata archaeon]|nr:cobyrinate a,c-diamide synthase [Thermoplasmata archaeon]